jgi:HAD superfamily hydrolase (TIGR01509 family)
MKNEKIYLFDVGGVLIDSMPSFISAISTYLDTKKIKIDKDLVSKILPLGYLSLAKYFKDLGVDTPLYTLVEELKQSVFRAYAFDIKEKKGALTKLLELKGKGARLIAVTTSPHIMSDSALIRLGMYELFDFVFSCDDLGLDKNNPKFYTAVADRCGENPEDLTLFDDNLDSLKAAKESGLTVYGVYDVSSYGDAEKIKEISVGYFKGISELS